MSSGMLLMLIARTTFAVKNELNSMLREFKESFNERLIMKRSFFCLLLCALKPAKNHDRKKFQRRN